MPAPGTPAPAFSLANQNGDTVNLADLAGKKVILFAFPRANTSGCAAQAKGFHDNLPQIEAAGGVVFGVSPDPVADLKAWHDQEKFGFDLLSDPDHSTIETYGAWGEKTVYGKTSIGVIRSHWVIGPDGNVMDERLKVAPAQSVALATETVTEG
jgi:peroxiredoxin Q/BCP